MDFSFKKATFLLILFSTILRLFLASQLEFGNDEVYYWLYAKFPDVSHFDHPAMVGFFIQFFTLNLSLDSELVIRLAAILPASFNMYLVFLIASYLKDERAGFIASILYNLSIYGLIISGTFILPDAPLVCFWLLSFYFLVQVLPNTPEKAPKNKLLWAYFFIGCAIYSKYQAVYLLGGIGLYVLFFNRSWLKEWRLYLGVIFPVIAVGLIYFWNYENDFISYKFHGDRVSFFNLDFNKDYLLQQLLGQIGYNNPYIFIMIVVMLVAFFKKRFVYNKNVVWFFICFSLPLILTTIYLSISRFTLPHWSGVSYLVLIPLLAVYLSKSKTIHKGLLKGFTILSIVLVVATFVINKGWFLPRPIAKDIKQLSRNDALMDMYGWQQAAKKITQIITEKKLTNLPIISEKWFPAAHIDYYIARPNKMLVYGKGTLKDIHKYYWINEKYPKLGKTALYITDSRNYRNPKDLYKDSYNSIEQLASIPIERNGVVVKYVFLFKLAQAN